MSSGRDVSGNEDEPAVSLNEHSSRGQTERSCDGCEVCRFKLQWSAVMQPLIWHVYSRPDHYWHPERKGLVHEDWFCLFEWKQGV